MKFALIAAALLACAPPRSLSFEGAPPDAFAAAYAAASEWNASCGVDWTLSSGPGDVAIVLVPEGTLPSLHGGEVGGDNVVRIDARYRSNRALYAHELGHVLRLGHAERGVMAAFIPYDAHVVAGDCP